MSDYELVIIGGGLSGLAAGIRFARFGGRTLILEQHYVPGGLNSYYFRQGFLLETGLHAMTNFAGPKEKHAPLNRLFRQLKLSRKRFTTHEQFGSQILFADRASLLFSNDFSLLEAEIHRVFPHAIDGFRKLVNLIDSYDPFTPKPWLSAREKLAEVIGDELFVDMLLCPLMVYGNSAEHDMDFGQFVIMFRAIFQEGFFRPHGTIRDFLDMLLDHYRSFDGEIRFKTKVRRCIKLNDRISGVQLDSGETISCDHLVSTIGWPGTLELLEEESREERRKYHGQMSFMETITILPQERKKELHADQTIIFYNYGPYDYCRPVQALDPSWGVICLPENFQGMEDREFFQVRVTNAANYDLWKNVSPEEYKQMKVEWLEKSAAVVSEIIGNYRQNRVYEDSFTPVTIEKFTAKAEGAVYGSPVKIKDGRTPFENMFIAGTDQGYLGIVGSMLSGVTMVNQHLLR
ncbi:MAG: FAD-dependent oxidoreductase [Desulfobulbaceae bacterium]|nr:FAD-dependent oxidoreductase [Desulfobulbaceae bacterium]